MKILQTQSVKLNSTIQQNAPERNPQVAFKGVETPFIEFLRFLATNQAWGAVGVDLSCMGAPRTAIDFTRGPDAGIETARREFSSTANHTLIGTYGLTAAFVLAQALNKEFGVKAHTMFVSSKFLDILGHNWIEVSSEKKSWKRFFDVTRLWDKSKRNKDPLEKFIDRSISSLKGFSPEHANCDNNGWVKLGDETRATVVKRLLSEVNKDTGKISKDTMDYLKAVIVPEIGSDSKVKIGKTINGKKTRYVNTLENVIDGIYKVSKTLKSKKVTDAFNAGDFSSNRFINGLKKLNSRVAICGMGIAIAIGLSLQPLNAYLTKKKTGKSGFVGVEGREPDKSDKFKLLKTVVAAVVGISMIRTIGPFRELLSKVQFKGFTPTIEQFKLIYGMTIISRLLSARDKNELRESATKDTLGFANWLILGGFVSTLSAAAIEKMSMFKGEKFIRYNAAENGGHWFDWLTKSSIISRDEVLFEAIKKAGKTAIKADGKAMSFKEMFEFVSKFDKMAIKKVRYLGLIQFAGYLYSGLALGVGIPKLNIAVTKHLSKKHHHKLEENKGEENKTEKDISKQNA